MRKVLTIATREYRAMVGTKAFLISIVMMPVLMLGSLVAMSLFEDVGEVKNRRIAVIDQTGVLFAPLAEAAAARNAALEQSESTQKAPGARESRSRGLGGGNRELYLLEPIEAETVDDDLRLELSDQIRNQQLYAFIEIPAGLIQPAQAPSEEDGPQERPQVRFYSQDSGLSEARGFMAATLSEIVKNQRLEEAGIDPNTVRELSQGVGVRGLGLISRTAEGTIGEAQETDAMQQIFLPMGVMMLMFMVIFMASQPMLESVIEEKSQRIAEVLLGSANPFQLMSGKLLGTVAGSLTIFGIYLAGGYFLAIYQGWTDAIPFHLAGWFVAFQIVGVLFYAAIFMAVGASVSQLKEAQSMLLPVWMLLMCPMFVWLLIVRDPLGPMATGFSLFPPATPTTMMLRMATGQTIPLWQPLLGLGLTIVATLLIVVLAARIFRVGILWQGKTPRVSEILRWALLGS